MIGYIYKIANLETDEIYIGSTFNMEERLISHKENYITWFNNNNNPYRQAFDILKYPSYYMELIEEVEVLTRLEMEIIEGQYQRENECVNIRKAGKTKETIFIQSQGYRLKYKDKINKRT